MNVQMLAKCCSIAKQLAATDLIKQTANKTTIKNKKHTSNGTNNVQTLYMVDTRHSSL